MSQENTLVNHTASIDVPRGDAAGLVRYLRYDLLSGILVFLIALPLCLGIALASGFPAIAGVFTAIVGALVCPWISNSELTIKGPAAGMIVIMMGCVSAFGGDGFVGGVSPADEAAYRMALAVVVVAAALQIGFGLARGGVLGEFFPTPAVHGMLAAIGLIIMLKQIPVALGVKAQGDPVELIRELPRFFRELNPEIALIGGISVLLMFLWPSVQKLIPWLKAIPAAMAVIAVAIPLGQYFDLTHTHTYSFNGQVYKVGESYLVNMPDRVFGMFEFVQFPDFGVFTGEYFWQALKWTLLVFVIGSLESVLSAKAIDIIDPWKRHTNFDRDLTAVGVANFLVGWMGGLPMISEIVRSKANIDNGARTRFANMWHGVFLLLAVALVPTLLHRIPLAALAGMLIYTGFRLTHPREFLHIYSIGKEQLLVFLATMVGVITTDLLVGILIGIGVKLLIHVIHGVPLRSLFKSYVDIEFLDDDTAVVRARYSAVFSNWLLFRRSLMQLGFVERKNVIVDLSEAQYVDHSVMEKLHHLQAQFADNGLELQLRGLDLHLPLSEHQFAARRRTVSRMRRVTVIAPKVIEHALIERFFELGASGYTSVACEGVGRKSRLTAASPGAPQVRLEAIVPHGVADKIFDYLHSEVISRHPVTTCLETVEVLRHGAF